MKYTRKDVVGQEESFEGGVHEIVELIKLLELNNDNNISLGVDDDGYLLLINEESIIDIREDGEY